jgi:hypothetical protein
MITMSKTRRWILTGILDLMALQLFAQQPESILVDNVRPVHAVARELESRYGWRITYEDPAYTDADYQNTLLEGSVQEHGILKQITPHSQPIRFTVNIGTDVQEAKRLAIYQILAQHKSINNVSLFEVLHNADYSHIVPLSSGPGALVHYRSILDVPVNVSVMDLTVGEIVNLVLRQVSVQKRIPIVIGAIPLPMFMNERISLDARNRCATDVLVEIFERLSNRSVYYGLPERDDVGFAL